MSFYEEHYLPHILHLACGVKDIQKQREKVVPLAQGRVLEISMGSGLNTHFCNTEHIELVWWVGPSEGMRKKAQKNLKRAPFETRWLDSPCEEIPLDDNSVDTIVLTYTLCTIPDWQKALQQMRRVLKLGANLFFCEHGEAPDENVRKWQNKINPMWGKIAGGCHLNRLIPRYLIERGFKIETMESEYIPGLKVVAFNYWGTAKQA